MTLTELIVALALLMLVLMTFTPMLLSSYDNLYQAGEKNVDTYTNKSEIEKKLSIREQDPLIDEGIRLSFRKFSNELVIQAKHILTSVEGLETIYGTGKVRVKILTDDHISDNQSYYPVIINLINLEGLDVKLGTGHEEGKVVFYIQSVVQKSVDINSKCSISRIGSTSKAKLIIDDLDISYAPFKIFVYYYDEYGKAKTTETYLYVSPADAMFVGKVGSDTQYISSAGVDPQTNTLLLAGRTFCDSDANVSNSTAKYNKVRWVTANGAGDATLNSGTYIMVGDNSLVRRLWNISDTATGSVYSNVFDATKTGEINGRTIYKYTWGGDYINANKYGRSYDKKKDILPSDDHTLEYSDYGSPLYTTGFSSSVKAVTINDPIDGGTKKLMPISYVLEEAEKAAAPLLAENGYFYGNGSSRLLLANQKGTQKDLDGNTIKIDLNWRANDGYATVSSSDAKETDTNTYCNCLMLSDVTAKNTGYKNVVGKNWVPLIFFSSSDSASGVDRFYLVDDNNWGAQVQSGKISYATRLKDMWTSIVNKDWADHHGTDGVDAWVNKDINGNVIITGCPPYDKVESRFYDYFNEHQNSHPEHVYDFYHEDNNKNIYKQFGTRLVVNKWKNNDPSQGINLGWNSLNWRENATDHCCWYCDRAAKFTTTLSGYSFIPYADYNNPDSTTLNKNQQVVKDFISDYFLNEANKKVIKSTNSAFVGGEIKKEDENAAWIRLKSYSNATLTFDKVNYANRVNAYKKAYDILLEAADDNYNAKNNSNSAQVNLTDVYYIISGSGNGCVYTGVTPASALVYTPYSAGAHNSMSKSDGYRIFIIQSYGTDGYSIYQSVDGIGHDPFKDKDTSVLTSGVIAVHDDYETASFTIGYSSNHNLVYSAIAKSTSIDWANLANWKSTDTNLYYPSDFYSITTYSNCENYIFGAGYCVSGQAGVDASSQMCSSTFHNQTDTDSYKGVVDMTDSSSFFSSENFHKIHYENDKSRNAPYLTTLLNGPGTIVNDENATASTDNYHTKGYFFETHIGLNYMYIESYPTCASAFTTLTKVGLDDCEAVTNQGVLVYMQNGDNNFHRVEYTISGGIPHNFKFSAVSVIKDGSNKLKIAVSGTDGCVYTGTAQLDDGGNILGTVTFTKFKSSKISKFNSVCYAQNGDTNYIVASGNGAGGAYVCVNNGSTWSEIKVSDTAYSVNDIQIIGDYVYCVGNNGNSGVVFFKSVKSFGTDDNWGMETNYYTDFNSDNVGKITGKTGGTLPALYSCAGKA